MLQTITVGMLGHERGEHDRLMASLYTQLGAVEVEELLRQGRSLTFDGACDEALRGEKTFAATDEASERPMLKISDLGPLQISLGGVSLDLQNRASARARELLIFLMSQAAGRTKEEVGVALWPDASPDQVRNSFHVTLHRLRKMLGRNDVIGSDAGRYRIDADYPQEAASRLFERETAAALRDADASPEALEKLRVALSRYEGDYLQGEEFGEWTLPVRAHLRQLYLRGLFTFGQRLETRGRYDEAVSAYTRITSREPFDEAAWRQLMVCRARLGARADSLQLYRQLEQRLRSELATNPEPETITLFRRLQHNELP
jgi:DNA-binding SARP family transcriptional activator